MMFANAMWIIFIALVVGFGLTHFREVSQQIDYSLGSVNDGLRLL